MDYLNLYSRSDGVVDWNDCHEAAADAVEVPGSHIGMAFSPAVYKVLREHLPEFAARHAGRCKPISAAKRASELDDAEVLSRR